MKKVCGTCIFGIDSGAGKSGINVLCRMIMSGAQTRVKVVVTGERQRVVYRRKTEFTWPTNSRVSKVLNAGIENC